MYQGCSEAFIEYPDTLKDKNDLECLKVKGVQRSHKDTWRYFKDAKKYPTNAQKCSRILKFSQMLKDA